jgi:hypothetical protein
MSYHPTRTAPEGFSLSPADAPEPFLTPFIAVAMFLIIAYLGLLAGIIIPLVLIVILCIILRRRGKEKTKQ